MILKNVETRFLKKGDRLVGSGSVVLVDPYTTTWTPSGKTNLKVRDHKGRERWVTWNASTKFTVERN